ncbi:autotransporter strand-loop-strand O-heptosyltransferase [Swaminathania salitolerans]|uniref:Autotransporter strand-loop-strand O-heptosyltransferase n=1 Tax=Swaminathania salitolerans TaxID=182838 RepID=A0A511BT67_9PROT|nr:autotransporter strand-loop-strand O-heptosyltransferase [Swaminathania salitolerans]GBQ10080.1 glycosyltransferase [Swaminathania salitolerans LMG 21291]GEL01158.1 autotransporter strand-loop-strand O-heptosyltransferase [Swaminathania salitolerans]
MNETPSQIGPEGIRYDFQDGCRVSLPPGKWHIELRDRLTQTVIFAGANEGGLVCSTKKYHVPFSFRITREGQTVFAHDMALRGHTVLIDMHLGGIGDHLAWMGHVEAFAALHGCHVLCLVRPGMAALFAGCNEAITITDDVSCLEEDYYARYKVLIFFNDTNRDHQPTDYRQVGLGVSGAYILGLPPKDRRPSIAIAPGGPPMEEPYVCIATQATGHNKYWNNPFGWAEIIPYLKKRGFRVVCIDRDRVQGNGTIWHHIPHGAEDMTGSLPLSERARWLKHAAFFIGLSSGLSWLAWAAGCPVVMISGFTEPFNEFETPYRVINRNVCNGCSNDVTIEFERQNYFWCPRHANTERDFECTKMISSAHVEQVIEELLAGQGIAC